MTRFGLAGAVIMACLFAAAAVVAVPRGLDAQAWLAARDEPAELADRALDRGFDAVAARHQIETALAAGDPDLAGSFVELAQDRKLAIDPGLAQRVDDAKAEASSAGHLAGSFVRGLVVGEPDDLVSLAGTATGDLFVFGDIRDAVREGGRLALGQPADRLVLGLACVGMAVTAGTYASLGAGAPARVGLSLVKAAQKTGRVSARMGGFIGRSLRGVVDTGALRRAFTDVSLTNPALAVRAARDAVKMERAEELVSLVGNVGRVQAKAGTRAALDGLRLAEGPRDMARVVKLAEKSGGKTRAILRLLGRGAIALTLGAFDLSLWILWAAFTLLGFVASLKAAAERATWRHLQRRKLKRARQALREAERAAAEARAANELREAHAAPLAMAASAA